MKYYSGIKMNKIMPLATTWMNLEIFVLRKVRQRKFRKPGFGPKIRHKVSALCSFV